MMDLKKFEAFKDTYLKTLTPSKVTEAMAYVLDGGQRIRTKLLLALLDGRDIPIESGFNSALALEMIHAYSLIHDDLPCMDDDDMRRGKPSCHIAFGEDIAVLTGDALLTDSFALIAKDKDLNDHQKLMIIKTYSEEAGSGGMVYGQVLDLANEDNKDAKYEDILNIARFKTGCLFKAATKAAMYIIDDEDNEAFYDKLAIELGLVFQMQDDLFDITKSTSELGKPSGSDIKEHKATAMTIMDEKALKDEVERRFMAIIEMIKKEKGEMDALIGLITYIKDR